MAEEMVIRRWCDPCQAAGKRTEATRRWQILIRAEQPRGGANTLPRVLDTCEPCAAPLYTAADLARALGRPDRPDRPDRPAPAGAPATVDREYETCPVCGVELMAEHLNKHLAGTHRARVAQPKRCPDCKEPIGTSAAMIRHRRKHGYDYRAAMLAAAQPRRRG